MKKIHFDLETADPDDVMALALLATHPAVDLVGVTVYPGGLDQIGLVKKVLSILDRKNIPVGANIKDDRKERVGIFYKRWLGEILPAEPDDTATNVLSDSVYCKAHLLTGAALTNIWKLHENVHGSLFDSWTCQGGFAGDSVVPEEYRLEKFKGRETCPIFNLNGNPKASVALLASDRIKHKHLVSKNVCHGFWFGPKRVNRIPRAAHPGLDLLLQGMEIYFKKHPEGKALHDILAAVLAIRPELAIWAQGEPYRQKGEWGFREKKSNTHIVIAVSEGEVEKALSA
jgi:hypothetical protein